MYKLLKRRTGIYMMDWWEKYICNFVLLLVSSFVTFAILRYFG